MLIHPKVCCFSIYLHPPKAIDLSYTSINDFEAMARWSLTSQPWAQIRSALSGGERQPANRLYRPSDRQSVVWSAKIQSFGQHVGAVVADESGLDPAKSDERTIRRLANKNQCLG